MKHKMLIISVLMLLLCFFLIYMFKDIGPVKQTATVYDATPPAIPYDLIIDEGIYKSYFNNTLHEPVFVSYDMFNGGGREVHCKRNGFHFYNDRSDAQTAKNKDYKKPYDKGHLADAEDFAFDCDLDEKTFRYYNCVPQTEHLNRGPWREWETIVRKQSASDSLHIVTGSIFSNKCIGPDSIYVPDYCWKVVESISRKTILEVIYCDNTDTATCDTISFSVLRQKLGYNIPMR